jgi:hypothetical protein
MFAKTFGRLFNFFLRGSSEHIDHLECLSDKITQSRAVVLPALRHARTIRVVIGELAKLNAERELRIITRQLADLTRRAEPAPHSTGDAP